MKCENLWNLCKFMIESTLFNKFSVDKIYDYLNSAATMPRIQRIIRIK